MEDDEEAPSRSPSRSPSQPPSSPSPPPVAVVAGPPNGRPMATLAVASASPVTVAAPPQGQTLTLALPIQHPRPSLSPAAGVGGGGGGGGREDCWSEGATSALVDAWGERYLELSRGNLKQKHWQEVADAVTSRDGYTKTPKTDVQCKNRIDTLKKKYKVEKSKIASGGAAASSWPFFHRLDQLLGPNHKPPSASASASANAKIPAGVPIRPPLYPQFPQRHRTPHPAPNQGGKRARSPPSVSSWSGGEMSPDSSEGLPPEMAVANGKRRRREAEEEEEGEEQAGEEEEEEKAAGLRELTRAILGFGEVYERVESSKLQQAMEMEKQRMGFARELELQRMQFFMKTQVELSQLKRHHHHHQGRRSRRRDDAAGASSNHLHHHHHPPNSSNSNNSHSTA